MFVSVLITTDYMLLRKGYSYKTCNLYNVTALTDNSKSTINKIVQKLNVS